MYGSCAAYVCNSNSGKLCKKQHFGCIILSPVICIGAFIGLNDIKLWTLNYKIARTKVQNKRSI